MMSSFFSLSTLTPAAASYRCASRALETVPLSLLTALRPHGILFVSGADMNLHRISVAAVLAAAFSAATLAQTTQDSVPARKEGTPTTTQEQFVLPNSVLPKKDSVRAEAYYNYTMGHIYEQQYEATSRAEYATSAIEAYKKAYALDPKSPVIGERLAEMYWKAQRIREADRKSTRLNSSH